MADIDEWCAKEFDSGHRTHLGASLIGEECLRKLFYVFRWCKTEKFDGRMQRLFQRGHREEDRFIEYLIGIGCKVWANDYDSNPLYYIAEDDTYYLHSQLTTELMQNLAVRAEGEVHIGRAKAQGIEFPQYKISAVGGHFGGSLDGIVLLPPHYGIAGPVLAEFKTNGTGAGFNKLTSEGMPVAKPQHFAQTSTYGLEYKFEWCLYLNTNKNDDSIHLELVRLNWGLGEQMKAKAEKVIMATKPPERLSNNPTFKSCAYCAMKPICHEGKPVDVNCRSCKHASPQPAKQWLCAVHNAHIPADVIPVGCASYSSINVV